MPPSPALRSSPGRDLGRRHKGRSSFESAATLGAKDDDLTLFNEMQSMERDDFLLNDSDDVNLSLSQLRCLPDYKLVLNIPIRGERSELLNIEDEKHDYDWLLTPPETPLFRSLDDDEPQSRALVARGRPRSQPIKVLRSSLSMNETTESISRRSASPHNTSRRSASPCGLSPSPRSSSNVTQIKSRPSSTSRASPPPAARAVTPSPIPRSSTPTLRRMSTGSSGQASSSGRRPASPMNSSRGNSASPKLRGWQSDVPPNLRMSTSDQVVAHARGMSPTPKSRKGRQSMSPTASRSTSSSRSHEQDRISSFSKSSIASSGDDDLDSLQSVAVSSSLPVRRNEMSVNNSPMTYSKRPSRTSSTSVVPKRSIDSMLRQMEHRKTPQSMFRPLLSSVPVTTLYAGKANSSHRPMISRNSSLTTSTSASSNQGVSVAPGMESSEPDQNDLPREWERIEDPNTHEDIFVFDNADGISEDSAGMQLECGSSMVNSADTGSGTNALEPTYATDYCSVVSGCENMTVCSRCGKCFQLVVQNEDKNICEQCEKIDQLLAVEPLVPTIVTENDLEKPDSCEGLDCLGIELQVSGAPEMLERSIEDTIQQGHDNCLAHLVTDQQLEGDDENILGQAECRANHPLRVDNPEGAGISLLLAQNSTRSKWPVVQGRAFSATNILCSDSSYLRDNTIALRRSFGRDSASVSSSTDLSSSRHSEVPMQRQFSSRRNEMGSTNIDAKAQSTSSPGPNSVGQTDFVDLTNNVECVGLKELNNGTEQDHDETSVTRFSSIELDPTDDSVHLDDHSCTTPNSDEPLHNHLQSNHYDCLAEDYSEVGPCGKAYDNPGNANGCNIDDASDISGTEKQYVTNDAARHSDVSDAASHSVILESLNGHDNYQDPEIECIDSQIPSIQNVADESVVSTTSMKSEAKSISECLVDDHAHGVQEEPTVILEGSRGHTSRSLTLAEATDTILFCSSIVHNIVYKATAIGMANELPPLETSRPTVTIVGKSVPGENDSKTMPNKCTPKSQKSRRKKSETLTASLPAESEKNVILQVSKSSNTEFPTKPIVDSTKPPPKLESKCNCAIM